MRRNAITIIAFLLFALTALTQEVPQPVNAPGGEAIIADFKGTVSVKAADQSPLTPQRGLVLKPDSTIETGKGSVLLQMQDGSQVLVRAKSHVVITLPADNRGHWFDLMIGTIKAKVQKHLGNEPPFRLGTPTAVITVRGTEFVVKVDKKNKTSVYVYEGIVEFAGLAALDRPVLIKPGFSSQAEPGRPAESPQQINPSRDPEDRSGPASRNSEGSDSGQSRPGVPEPSDRSASPQPNQNQSREKPD